MVFGSRESQSAETDMYRIEEADYLTLKSLTFTINGADPRQAQIKLIGVYGKKTAVVEFEGQEKQLFEEWQSEVLLDMRVAQLEQAVGEGISAQTVGSAEATKLMQDLSVIHESIVATADQMLTLMQAAGRIAIRPTISRVTEK